MEICFNELSSDWEGGKVIMDNLLRIVIVKRGEMVVFKRLCGVE